MNRTVMMTLGFLFVFAGIQLNIVDSYVLTPRMANFLADQNPPQANAATDSGNRQFVQTGFETTQGRSLYPDQTRLNFRTGQPNRIIRPPVWWGWPVMFLGAVFFLNGLAIRK